MKALLCRELGSPDALAVEEVAAPKAGRGQVVLDVKAAGVNFPDILMVQGKYQFKPPLPFAPGCELAGFTKREPEANRANARRLLEWIAAGVLKPLISGRYPLSRGAEALRAVQDRLVKGKVVILPEA